MSKLIFGKIAELNDSEYKPDIMRIDIPQDISQIVLKHSNVLFKKVSKTSAELAVYGSHVKIDEEERGNKKLNLEYSEVPDYIAVSNCSGSGKAKKYFIYLRDISDEVLETEIPFTLKRIFYEMFLD
jgi:hypothetical protein